MLKYLENRTYELIGLGAFLFLCLLHILTGFGGKILITLQLIVSLYYFIKIILSFRSWKQSKGASLINAYINLMLFSALNGIGFLILMLPGATELIYICLTSPQYTIIIFGALILIRKQKFTVYWNLIKYNCLKWLVSILICLLLFYLYDIPEHIVSNGIEQRGFIKLF